MPGILSFSFLPSSVLSRTVYTSLEHKKAKQALKAARVPLPAFRRKLLLLKKSVRAIFVARRVNLDFEASGEKLDGMKLIIDTEAITKPVVSLPNPAEKPKRKHKAKEPAAV
jgi:hypothetical protein